MTQAFRTADEREQIIERVIAEHPGLTRYTRRGVDPEMDARCDRGDASIVVIDSELFWRVNG